MKKLFFIFFLFLLYGCPTYDPPPGLLYIRNNSDEAIYVYFKCGNIDSLPMSPKLELFYFFNNKDESMRDASGNSIESGFASPDYRVNAYQLGSIIIQNDRIKNRLLCAGNCITLFFITEKTMRYNDWSKIYEDQLFTKKVILTEEILKKDNWVFTYKP